MRRDSKFFPETEALGHGVLQPRISTLDETGVSPLEPTDNPLETPAGYIGTSLGARRLFMFFAGLGLLVIVLGLRVATLELLRGNEYLRRAEGNRLRIVPVPAERGVIRDRDGRLLVRNIPDFTLTVTPSDLPSGELKRMQAIAKIAESADLTPVDVEDVLKHYPATYASEVPVKTHLPYEKAELLEIVSSGLPGVNVRLGTTREYLLNDPKRKEPLYSLAHVLGYLGAVNNNDLATLRDRGYTPADYIGKAGVEASYEAALRGQFGQKQIEVNAFGHEQDVLAENAPVSGKDLTLTIDLDLQAVAERSLRSSARLNGKGRGAVVALNPKTGEILALVSFPGYDDNAFAKGISLTDYKKLAEDPNQPLYPRAVAGLYPPGSTVKLVVAATALATGVIDATTSFVSVGGIKVGQYFFPDWKIGGHGVTNVVKAIADSVNTFFYAIGGGWNTFQGLGITRLTEGFRLFGLGAKLGIDLPSEREGFVPTPEWKQRTQQQSWFIGDTYHTAIGQGGLTVTPLQAAAWTAVFANGGDLVRPHVVKELRGNTDARQVATSYVSKSLVSPDIIDTVRRGMRQTVLSGSAQSLKASPWNIAGKTGTAQWNSKQPNHAWFTGFAPYEDPQIVVTVLIEAGGDGSHSAVPVARDIIEAWLRKQKVPASRSDAQNTSATTTGGTYLD